MFMLLTRRTLVVALAGCLLLLAAGTGLARAGGGPTSTPTPPNRAITRVPTTAPDVAITFDDGPDPTFTPRMLAVLQSHHAVATFFVLGLQVVRYPNVVRAEAAQGSEVCNHGYSHKMLRGRSETFVAGDIAQTQQMLDRIGVPRCPLFRFPYLASDAAARSTAIRLGYRIIGANIDTEDWRQPSPARAAARVLSRIQRGDIILLHDGGGQRGRTVQTLTLILDGLRQRNLHAVTVSQLLATVQHGRPPARDEE